MSTKDEGQFISPNDANPNVSRSSIQMNTFRQELIDLYMQGWLDRDWEIGEDEADEKSEMYADQIMKKYKL